MSENIVRKVNKIQYSSKKRQAYIKFKRVNRGKINSLNINTKSINQQILRKSFSNCDQSKIIQKYSKMKPNFQTTKQLFGMIPSDTKPQIKNACQNIRLKMIQIYQSKQFIEFVLKNQKMDLQSKLSILAHLQQIRKSACCPSSHNQWKNKV